MFHPDCPRKCCVFSYFPGVLERSREPFAPVHQVFGDGAGAGVVEHQRRRQRADALELPRELVAEGHRGEGIQAWPQDGDQLIRIIMVILGCLKWKMECL